MSKSRKVLSSRQVELTSIVLILILAFLFFVQLFLGPIGASFELDTLRTVVTQFSSKWIEGDLSSRMSYFIEVSVKPHPKIVLRIITLLSYLLTGKVNLWIIDFLSNFGLAATAGLIYHHFYRKKSVYFIPVAVLLFTITMKHFWTVASVGLGYNYFFNLLFFVLLYKNKYAWSIPVMFIIVFRSGAGFLAFIPMYLGLIYWCYSKIMKIKPAIIVVIFSLLWFLLFQFYTLNGKVITPRVEESLNVSFFSKEVSLLIYFLQSLGSLWTSDHWINLNNKYLDCGFGIVGLAILIILLFKIDLLKWKNASLFSVAIYFAGLNLVAAIINDNPLNYFQSIANRYVVYSLFFWISIWTLIVINFSHLKWTKICSSLFIILSLLVYTFSAFAKYTEVLNENATTKKAIFNVLCEDYISKPRATHSDARSLIGQKIYYDGVKHGYLEAIKFNEILSSVFDISDVIIRTQVKKNSPELSYVKYGNDRIKINFYSERSYQYLLFKLQVYFQKGILK